LNTQALSPATLSARKSGTIDATWIHLFPLSQRFWQKISLFPQSTATIRFRLNWDDHRECHLKPDLLLIYRKPGAEVLHLIRLGSHSELFG
jgi:hypothetical protein